MKDHRQRRPLRPPDSWRARPAGGHHKTDYLYMELESLVAPERNHGSPVVGAPRPGEDPVCGHSNHQRRIGGIPFAFVMHGALEEWLVTLTIQEQKAGFSASITQIPLPPKSLRCAHLRRERGSPIASHRLTLQRDCGYPESNANVGLHSLGWCSQMS
jgi:hypothetical protein